MFSSEPKIRTIDDFKVSSKMFEYHTIKDASARLSGTYIRINDDIALVDSVNGQELSDAVITYRLLKDLCSPQGSETGAKSIAISLSKLPQVASITRLRTGYCNWPKNSYYLKRAATRGSRQSVNTQNIRGGPDHGIIYREMPALADMFNNKYPTFQSCVDVVEAGEKLGQAFHRDFKIGALEDMDELLLEFKGMKVGMFNDSRKAVKVPAKNAWIKETLEKTGISYV